MPRVLVLGPGFLGNRFAQGIPDAVLYAGRLETREQIRKVLQDYRPRSVVNCIGRTGRPNVDWCETHQSVTFRDNVTLPLLLAEECERLSLHLLHMGSGCIFYGGAPSPLGWLESDFANPVSVYSRSKYAADLALSMYPNVGIVRIRMPIDRIPSPRNLVTKLVGYRRIIDVENSVTVVEDLIHVVDRLAAHRATGIFHAVNPGVLRHRDLLTSYRDLVRPAHEFELIAEHELLGLGLVQAPRSNCRLQNTRLGALGIELRPIDEALQDTLRSYRLLDRAAS